LVLGARAFYYWYKNYLSDYTSDKQRGRWCSEKIEAVNKKAGELTQKPVYVLKPEHLGVEQIFMKHQDIKTACRISQDFKLWYAYENGTKPAETIKTTYNSGT
jgi:hypothetical protein